MIESAGLALVTREGTWKAAIRLATAVAVLALSCATPAEVIAPGEPAPPGDQAISLRADVWVLEDLGGTGVLDGARVTLFFPAPDNATGIASCNHYSAPVTLAGASISIGAIGTTRRSCPDAVMDQERRYLEALAAATRYEIDGPILRIFAGGLDAPLRFMRAGG